MRFVLSLVFVASGLAVAAAGEPVPLDPAVKEKCLRILRDGLASDEFWPAMHAAEALTYAGHADEVLANLAKRSETDDQKRCGLAREAVRAGDRSKLAVLTAILDKPGSNGHTHAAESLFKVESVGDEAKMRASVTQDADLKLKLMAAAALARSGDASALEVVRRHITHADFETRKIAAWVLGQVGDASDIPALRAGLPKETDPLARAYFAHALALLGDGEGRTMLGANLASTDAAVRTYAADFAGYCRCTEFRDGLVELLDDPVRDVRIRAAQSLLVLSLPPETLRGLPFAAFKPAASPATFVCPPPTGVCCPSTQRRRLFRRFR